MTVRLASVLFALTLPLAAQEPAPAPAPAPAAATAETLFYKAFYLDRTRDYAGAMDLYQKFLDAAPDHKHAPEAAAAQLNLLDRTGKSKERDAFKAKYEKQLAAAPKTPPQSGDRPAGGDGEGARGDRPAPGAGGQPGRGQRGGVMRGTKKIADMTAEETTQLKESVANSSRMVEMMRQNGNEEGAKKLETNLDALKKALDANKTEDAQKALDAIREAMPARGRGQGGSGQGGGGEGGGNRGGASGGGSGSGGGR